MKIKKLFAICIITLSFEFETLNCFSKTWLWANSRSGSGLDEGLSVSADADGNVFFSGEYDGSGGFLIKYNKNGSILWEKNNLGGGHAPHVSADAGGDVYITGRFQSATMTLGSITLTNTGGVGYSDLFIAKYNALGNLQWATSVGGIGDDVGKSVSTDAGGNVFVTGYFTSPTITFGSTTLINTSANDELFIAKYNGATGNAIWAKSAEGTGSEWSISVSANAGGNVFITGLFTSPTIIFGSTTLTNAASNSWDVFIAKYDPNGNMIWAKSAGGAFYSVGYSVSADESGNVFVTGSFNDPTITFGSITLTNTSVGAGSDVFIAKYGMMGDVLWAKNAGGNGGDIGYSVSADVCGNVFVTGSFNSPTITFGSTNLIKPAGTGLDPMFIVKYDAAGNVLCASALASGGDDESSVSADPFGNAYIGGDFEVNSFAIGPYKLTRIGLESVFVAKYTCGGNILTGVSNTNGLCSGQCTGTASAIPSGSCGIYTYNWSNGQTTQTITGLCAGTYTVIVTDAVLVSSTATVTITEPPPIASIFANVTIVSGGSTILSASGGTTYLWTPSTGLSCVTCSSPTASPQSTSTYCVKVTDANWCSDSSCVIVTVDAFCGEVFVPTAFSPNADIANDLLCLYGTNCIQSLSFIIYDRWGEKVFETNNSKTCWDGMYKGKKMNEGIFVYYLYVQLQNKEVITKRGNITLIK